HIALALRAGESLAAPPLERADRDQRLVPSFGQERLWFLDQLEPASATYNMSGAVTLRGRLDVGALERSLTEVLGRHEVLRTTFEVVDGSPFLRVHPPAPFPLARRSARSASALSRDEVVRRAAVEEAQRPFDLASGPLVRACLMDVDDEEHVLLVSMHHIASD